MTKSRGILKQRHVWTDAQLDELRRCYPHERSQVIADRLGISISALYGKANALNLHKSDAFLASDQAGRLRPGSTVGKASQFQKGAVPANKGTRRPGWAPGRMRDTQFKKGGLPQNWVPIGSHRVMDGYLQRKVTDTGYSPRDWRPVHVLLWCEHFQRDVPPDHCVIFKDGDRNHIAIENLEICSRTELMLKNTVHRLPEELLEVVRLKGSLTRRINKLEGKHK